WSAAELYVGQVFEPMHDHVEDSAENLRLVFFERRPELQLRLSRQFWHRLQHEKYPSVCEIRSADNIFHAVQDQRPHGIEQHFIAIAVELARCESAASGEPA